MFHTITMHSPVGALRIIAGDRGLRAILWGAEDAAASRRVDDDELDRGPHTTARPRRRPTRGVLRRHHDASSTCRSTPSARRSSSRRG